MSTPIKIYQGDSKTITGTITGLDSASGYTAKLYLKQLNGTAIDTITGSISNLVATWNIINDNSKSYPVGRHNCEGKVFDSDGHVITGREEFVVLTALNNDPS